MHNAPDPKSFAVEQLYMIAESLEDAQARIRFGEPLWSRPDAEGLCSMFEGETGKRQYIFALDIRIQQVTS